MPEINLRDIYPDQYNEDCFIEVSDAVAELFAESKRSEEAAKRKMYRYRAQYSLDQDDGIEHDTLKGSFSPEDMLEKLEISHLVAEAFKILTPVQARRVYSKYILKKSVAEIAYSEGVSWNSVNNSISVGLNKIRRHLSDDTGQS